MTLNVDTSIGKSLLKLQSSINYILNSAFVTTSEAYLTQTSKFSDACIIKGNKSGLPTKLTLLSPIGFNSSNYTSSSSKVTLVTIQSILLLLLCSSYFPFNLAATLSCLWKFICLISPAQMMGFLHTLWCQSVGSVRAELFNGSMFSS